MKPRVIAIDDDEMYLKGTETLFNEKQIPIATFSDSSKAIRSIEEAKRSGSPYKMAIVDFDMPIKGNEVVRSIKQIDGSIHTVILSSSLSKEEAALCNKAGADHIYFKRKSKEIILLLSEIASLKVKRGKLSSEEKVANYEWIKKILSLRGHSAALAKVASEVSKYALAGESVLVTGQSGVGKEQVARSIHSNSKRPGSFIAVNCGAISKDLVQSELFGHLKGSFTGAMNNQTGKFVAAHGGTIFLDEIGEMPLESQVKLLRVLQEREVYPVGSTKPTKIDVRIVAATNKNLQEEVRKGNFREDLFYRLNILPIQVPTLSERVADIEPIVKFIIEEKNRETGRKKYITDDAIQLLETFAWPGNIRELSNKIRKAYTLADDIIDRALFSSQVINDDLESMINGIKKQEDFISYNDFVESVRNRIERLYLEKAMVLANGKRADAARLTGLPYTTYIHKRKSLGLTLNQDK
ncbi:MAG: sigma-54-dependent Fis family transcriptional regulator [Bdellovibrionaceae bacterium]|jgi:DNA-binding NtrC family response regulator|nr:sigma-54-dependent Fis family transcriptional regulator [Pseudobdellovibrionaceae bacterium]